MNRHVSTDGHMTLLQLTSLVGSLVQVSETADVWVTAEISDLSRRGGHCYMDLVQKADNGNTVARSRAVIWANNFYYIDDAFKRATGQTLAAGIKVMLLVTASFHPAYGFSLMVSDINPEFTLGDMVARRREFINRLTAEGVIDMNRTLPWPEPCLNIAVISAPGAAGYGDFIDQLFSNRFRLKFNVGFFPAVMQGLNAPRSIIDALDLIAASDREFDCTVIIRGGGATDDLACFDDYDLAANIAQFPLPVMIGIGHERDVTLLDYVANMRVKTPTAAAEWLIDQGAGSLARITALASAIADNIKANVAGHTVQIERLATMLCSVTEAKTTRETNRLSLATTNVTSLAATLIRPSLTRLQSYAANLADLSSRRIKSSLNDLEASARLVNALSPMATLKRGYTITRSGKQAVSSAAGLKPGDTIETVFADGSIKSKITRTDETSI